MADTVHDSNPANALPPVSVAALLESAQRARKSGNLAAARALLRALTSQRPDLPQVWLLLATVAETRSEQRHALEQVLALDPRSEPAKRGLALLGAVETVPATATNGRPFDRAMPPLAAAGPGTAVPTQPAAPTGAPALVAAPVAAPPIDHAEVPRTAPGLRAAEAGPAPAQRDIRWPLYLVIGISALAVLIAAILIRGSEFIGALRPVPTAALTALGATVPVVPPAIETTSAPDLAASATPESGVATLPNLAKPTAALPSPEIPPTVAQPEPTTAPPTAIASPLATPRRSLAPGEVIQQGRWHAILIRPEDVVALDGSIGSFQPSGRFVLVLMAIGNDGPTPARLPADLFVLVDGAGKRFAPLPQLSTAYLNTYGRGQHGDLSMEDLIPSDGGNKSVPLIFDVPPSARPLYLKIGDSPFGWSIIP